VDRADSPMRCAARFEVSPVSGGRHGVPGSGDVPSGPSLPELWRAGKAVDSAVSIIYSNCGDYE